MAPTWTMGISGAPRGSYDVIPAGRDGSASRKVFRPDRIITAGADGQVSVSHWLPDQSRWNMFARGEQPIAWMPLADAMQDVTDDRGVTRNQLVLPKHPTMAEPWFATFMREVGNAIAPGQRQQACLAWIAARAAA